MQQRKPRGWLVKIRRGSELTQTDVATGVGISLTHYQWIEYGKRNPSPALAERIAEFLGFPVAFFMGDGRQPADAINHCNVIIAQDK